METEQGEIRFPEISTAVLETVIKYFYYKARTHSAMPLPAANPFCSLPPFPPCAHKFALGCRS